MSDETQKQSKEGMLWGRMAALEMPARVGALAFVAAALIAMSFCQLGFLPFVNIDDKPVYLILILAPLLMGALMFGPVMGGLLGLFAGAVVFAHAQLFPLDFYEIYYMSWLNTFVLLTVIGAVSGLLFSLVVRRMQSRAARVGLILVVVFAMSFVTSVLLMAGVIITFGGLQNPEIIQFLESYLLNSPRGTALQVLLDALLMALLCCMADSAVMAAEKRGLKRKLLTVFRNWMLLVSVIVFMLANAVIFSFATMQERINAEKAMKSEVEYLTEQIDIQKVVDYGALLKGYDVSIDGYIAVLDEKGFILTSNDETKLPKGSSYGRAIVGGNDSFGDEDEVKELLAMMAEMDEMAILQEVDDEGVQTMGFAFVVVGAYDGGYITLLRTSDMVYAERGNVMASSTLLAFALIVAISILATILLRRVVVLRIDDTNNSLAKITEGNLRERVHQSDTYEFSALANGINSTVTALNSMMEEVAARNAQDLATAKAIQESALPREFPPFPEIDKFDIYASMKTAKEVGGDFYDFFLIGEENDKVGFVMADVSGKGIPAALFMMTAKTLIRNYMESGLPLGEAIDAANRQLCVGNDAGMFVTTWVGVLDYNTGLLGFVNGGHNPPMLMSNGSWEWVKEVSGMPLGLFDGIPYEEFERQLAPGDMIYTYTDGVTEAMDVDGNLFEEDRLEATLETCKEMNPRSVGVEVRRVLGDFTMNAEQSDDITMLIVKYGAAPERSATMVLDADEMQLGNVFDFLNEELKRRQAPKSVFDKLDIAAEELFVNVCRYAYPDAPGKVRISYEYRPNPPALIVTMVDDGIPFDPLANPDSVMPDNIADAQVGGMGILLVKNSVDEIAYERVGNSNVVTFTKGW